MFKKLQRKWKVSGTNLLLILITFALGGSICGYAGRKIMVLLAVKKGALWVIIYIIILTIIWPACVLLTSIPLGQFVFFKKYISKLVARFSGRKGQFKVGSSESAVQNSSVQEAVGNGQCLPQHLCRGSIVNESLGQKSIMELQSRDNEAKVNLAIFASGAGSNAQKIIHHFKNNPAVKIVLIVCNKPGAGVLKIAGAEHIDTLIIEKHRFYNEDAYINELKKYSITHIILAGFLWKIPAAIIKEWPAAIINIHPALLPKYGGKGMYGLRVHEAVITNKEKESGISIHYVDEVYDHGAIILQARCPVTETDTPQSLAEKIHVLEHQHYPAVIEEVIKAKTPLNKTAANHS